MLEFSVCRKELRIRSRAFEIPLRAVLLLIQVIPVGAVAGTDFSLSSGRESTALIEKMEAAYAQVGGYKAETEIREYRDGQAMETKRFLYTFKKPMHVRIDVELPYQGMVLIYPDEKGKVTVKPGGLFALVRLHLSPDSALFVTSTGQRIDQTDLGLLIRNIGHSLTDGRRGEITTFEHDGLIHIKVLAQDHFLHGVLTLYQFSIDRTRWLPVEVREFTPEGVVKREVFLQTLRTSISIPDTFFRIDGERLEHASPDR